MKNPIKNMDEDFDFTGIDKKIIEELKLTTAIRDRRVYISDSINDKSMFKTIYLIKRIVDLDKKESKKEPIEIIVDSYGGYIYHGLALISLIEQLKEEGYTIITTVQSVAMSMGVMISLTGSIRQASRHTRFMFHQPSSGTWGELEKQQRDVKETEALWVKMKEIIIKYTSITDEQLENMKDRCFDWYLWSDEALKLNVIDKIL
jgi:ATP-dependent Clp protease protease subunit